MIGNRKKLIGLVGAFTVLAGQFAISTLAVADEAASIESGKELAFDRKKGNCLACHNIPDGPSPGNIAPALVAMKSRFATKEDLYKQIWDPTVKNPESTMPPFGKHGIISEKELNDVVEYIWTL